MNNRDLASRLRNEDARRHPVALLIEGQAYNVGKVNDIMGGDGPTDAILEAATFTTDPFSALTLSYALYIQDPEGRPQIYLGGPDGEMAYFEVDDVSVDAKAGVTVVRAGDVICC